MGYGISIAVTPPGERDDRGSIGAADRVRGQVVTSLTAAGLEVHLPGRDAWEEVDAQSDVLTVEVYSPSTTPCASSSSTPAPTTLVATVATPSTSGY